jgi:hypothetical protein
LQKINENLKVNPFSEFTDIYKRADSKDLLSLPFRTTARGSRAANPAFAQMGNVTGNANVQRTNPDKTRAPAPAQVDNDVPLGWEKKMDPKVFLFGEVANFLEHRTDLHQTLFPVVFCNLLALLV